MKTTPILFFAMSVLFIAACSDDDDNCTQSDWIGTYSLKSSNDECEEPGVELDDEFTITAGANANSIRVDGIDYPFANCKVVEEDFDIEIELDGDEITFEIFDCKGKFRRK